MSLCAFDLFLINEVTEFIYIEGKAGVPQDEDHTIYIMLVMLVAYFFKSKNPPSNPLNANPFYLYSSISTLLGKLYNKQFIQSHVSFLLPKKLGMYLVAVQRWVLTTSMFFLCFGFTVAAFVHGHTFQCRVNLGIERQGV